MGRGKERHSEDPVDTPVEPKGPGRHVALLGAAERGE